MRHLPSGTRAQQWLARRRGWHLALDQHTQSRYLHSMRDHLSALIIASALLLSTALYCVSHRYSHTAKGYILDHWTGQTQAGTSDY